MRDLHKGDSTVTHKAVADIGEANMVVARLPYRSGEDRTATESLKTITGIAFRLSGKATAVVIAAADTLAGLEPKAPKSVTPEISSS